MSNAWEDRESKVLGDFEWERQHSPRGHEDLSLQWLTCWKLRNAGPCGDLIFFPSPLMLSSDLSSISRNIQTVEGREWLTMLYVRSTCLPLKYACYLIVNIINAFFNLTNSDLWVLQIFTLQSSKWQRENKAIRVLQDFWKGKCEELLKSYFLNQIQWLKGPRNLQPCVKRQNYIHLRAHII